MGAFVTLGAFFMGALVPTLLLSRLALLVTRRWNGGYLRLLVANGASLVACTALGSIGMADGGDLAVSKAFLGYLLPQLVCLAFDVWRYWRKKAEVIEPARFGSERP